MSLWDKVWSLDAPSKAKHLLWRLSGGLLPEYRQIRRRVVAGDASCFSYDGKDEDVSHTLFKCEYARAVWFASPLSLRVEDMNPFDSPSDSVLVLCGVLDDGALAMWAMLAWGLWFNRNRQCQGKKGYEPMELIGKVLEELNWFQRTDSDVEMVDAQDDGMACWVAPPTGWVKINCHASRIYRGCVGMGCVIRDDMGCVVGCFTDRQYLEGGRRTSKGVQELVVYESLLFGLDMGFRSMIVESDCLRAVRKWQLMEWETSGAAEAVVGRLQLHPKDYEFSVGYVSRDGNRLAKSVAEFATEVDEFTVWIDDLPDGIDMM